MRRLSSARAIARPCSCARASDPRVHEFADALNTHMSGDNALKPEGILSGARNPQPFQNERDRALASIEAAGLGTWSFDIETGAAYFDRRCRELLDVCPDAVPTLDLFLSRIHPDDRPAVAAALEASIATRGEYGADFRVVQSEHVVLWIASRGRVRVDACGHPTTFHGVNFDITDRKAYEDALRTSVQHFRFLIESGILGIARFTFTGEITDANDAFLRMVQFDRHDLRAGAVRWDRLTPAAWMDRTLRAVEQFKLTGTIQPYEKQYRRKDGSCFWGLFGGARVSDDEGIAFVIDITDRKNAEEALRRSNEHLQQFASAASHDLQEPLRTIRGLTEVLSRRYRDNLPADARSLMDMIVDAGARMNVLIDDLLAFSRASASGDDGRSEPVDAGEALDTALKNLHSHIAESHAVIEAGDLPVIQGDPVRFPQVFQNLISNAIKYRKMTEAPRISITADMRNGQWTFAVSDNGIGFQPEQAERIFRVFKRLHGNDIPGSGIGLAICKTIVEQQGGQIWAESRYSEGATFYFTADPARVRD